MSLTLYVGSKRYSSWSLRPFLALSHAGASFETTTILLDQPDSKANLVAVSPSGQVPVLHHDGVVVWDSLAICEYVAELFPDAKLWPAGRSERARARSMCAEMHGSFRPLRLAMGMDIGSQKPGQGHTPEALADARRIQTIWREAIAASGGPFLFGAFTNADAFFAPVATRFVTYGVDMDDVCKRYVDTIYALPAMQDWIADAGRQPKTRP